MLTEKLIRAMSAKEKDYTFSDGRGVRGDGVLMLRVRPSGLKELYFQRHEGGRRIKTKLGNWPALSLPEARIKCREAKNLPVSASTFKELLDGYVASLEARGAASAANVKWIFKRYVHEAFPKWVSRPALLITPAQIRDIIARMINSGITTTSNRLRSSLHSAFQWGLEQEFNPRQFLSNPVSFGLCSNPVACVPVQSDWERAGDRNLSVVELAALWQMLPEHLSLVTSELIRFLIASGGQRPKQLLATMRAGYSSEYLVITNAKAKRKEQTKHVVPITALMRESMAVMDQIDPKSRYIWMGKEEGKSLPVESLSRAVRLLCKRHPQTFNEPFTLRDLRRTCKTLMGLAGIDKQLRDRIQGHAFSDISSKHYDRYDYLKEKTAGLEHWEQWLQSNVVAPKNALASP